MTNRITTLSYPYTDIITKSYKQCPLIHVTDTTNISNANFRPDLNPFLNCKPNADFRIKQTAGIDANCLVDSLTTNVADLIDDSAQPEGEYLKNAKAFSQVQTKQQLWNKIKTRCEKNNLKMGMRAQSTHVADISATVVPTCDAYVIQPEKMLRIFRVATPLSLETKVGVQGATDLTSCMINSLQELATVNIPANSVSIKPLIFFLIVILILIVIIMYIK